MNLHRVKDTKNSKRHYFELGENNDIIKKDAYELSENTSVNMSKNGLETLGKIISSYGSIEAAPNEIW